jgi:hypothetical protein
MPAPSPVDLIMIADQLVKLRATCQAAGLAMYGVSLVDFVCGDLETIAINFRPLLSKYDPPQHTHTHRNGVAR